MSYDFQKNLGLIRNSVSSLDMGCYQNLLNDCLHAIKAGNKVIVSGLGKNVPVCEKFVGSMLSAGLNAAFLHTSTAVHGDLGMVRPGDVVIMLSKSGNTPESLLLAEQLNRRNYVRLWSFTFNAKGGLCDWVENHIVLQLEHEGDPWNMMPMNSTVATLFVLQGLATDLINETGISLADFQLNHPGGGIRQASER